MMQLTLSYFMVCDETFDTMFCLGKIMKEPRRPICLLGLTKNLNIAKYERRFNLKD
jgi:hypothetical protein